MGTQVAEPLGSNQRKCLLYPCDMVVKHLIMLEKQV